MAAYSMKRDRFNGKIVPEVEHARKNTYAQLRVETTHTIPIEVMMHFIEDMWDDIDKSVRESFARKIHILDLKDALKDPDSENEEDEEDFKW